MLCPNCSTALPDTATQCTNCGAGVIPIAADTAPDATAAGPYQAASSASAPYAAAPQGASNDPYAAAQQQAYQAQPTAAQPQQAYQAGQQQAQPGGPYAQAQQPYQQAYYQPAAAPAFTPAQKNHIVAGVLGVFLGSLGIHKFYLGYSKAGLIMLLVSLLGSLITFGLAGAVMAIIGLIEGIMYLVKSDEEFYYTYELTTKEWF